jgi:hypothetical protein
MAPAATIDTGIVASRLNLRVNEPNPILSGTGGVVVWWR